MGDARQKQKQRNAPPGPGAGPRQPTAPIVSPAAAGAALAPSAPPNDKATLTPLIEAVERIRGRPCIVYHTTPMARMSSAVEAPLYDILQRVGKQKGLDLLLHTNGGEPEAAWRVVSLVREFCDEFAVLIPHRAMSAGTLLSLGANEIVMSAYGTLGPIDPSRTHPLLPRREGAEEAEPISVQDMRHAMQFVREAAGSGLTYTPEAMARIFATLFDKIHPLAIGAIEQTYALAKLIGTNCLRTHMDPIKDRDQIGRIVDRLCDEYKSHGYPVSRREAKEIGLNVVEPDAALDTAMRNLLLFYGARPTGPFGLVPGRTPQQGQNLFGHIAWLDSQAFNTRVHADYVVMQTNEMQNAGDRWEVY